MAEGYESPKDWLGNVKGSAADAKKVHDAANKQRRAAETIPKILSVKDIQNGKWDADRTLMTTLGGVLREITQEDLKAFKENIKTVKDNFTGGMTAQQIINHSQQIDRERASKQITMATPVSASKGTVRFITNAGGETKGVHRHHVTVEFLRYESEASSADTNKKQAANRLRNSPLKIDCDCGRFRFWYSYIASIGGFKLGTQESGFPKIRNAKLKGVGCKHILRVMQEVRTGGAITMFLAKQMEKGKAHDENKAASFTSQKEAEKITKSQAKRTSDKHAVKIKAAIEKARKENPKETKKKAPATKAAKPNKNMTDPHAQMRLMLKQLGQTDTQIEAMIAASIAAQGK